MLKNVMMVMVNVSAKEMLGNVSAKEINTLKCFGKSFNLNSGLHLNVAAN